MTGLQKIIDGILEEADASVAEISQKAQEEAARIADEAKRGAEQYLKEQEVAARSEAEKYEKQIVSACEAKTRTVLLTEKQKVLSETLRTAYDALCNMPTEEYTQYVETLISAHLREGDCTMYMAKRDLERLPQAFFDRVTQNAAKNGCRLTLSKEPKAMDGGCLLSYGGIEENCSFGALFAAKESDLLDRTNQLLFG